MTRVYPMMTFSGTGASTMLATPKPAYAQSLSDRVAPTIVYPGSRVIFAEPPPADSDPPVTLFISGTRTRVSAVTGFETTDVTWSANEDCQAWQIRDITDAVGQTVADGVLVAAGGAIAGHEQQVTTITSSALSAGEGVKTLKLFAQDLAGNWTT